LVIEERYPGCRPAQRPPESVNVTAHITSQGWSFSLGGVGNQGEA